MSLMGFSNNAYLGSQISVD